MATWDAADLELRCRRLALRPSSDAAMVSDDSTVAAGWYALLTEAQALWYANFLAAGIQPADISAPTTLSSSDSGVTYQFSGSARPYSVWIYDAADGQLLVPGAYDDPDADYVWENDQIRMTLNTPQTFADGPVGRYIAAPGAISASSEPTLQPDFARILLVYRALVLWANRGGVRDARPFETMENDAWYGDPTRGKMGLLGMLKMQNPLYGGAAYRHSQTLRGRDYLFARYR